MFRIFNKDIDMVLKNLLNLFLVLFVHSVSPPCSRLGC
jgi:hypothetical protein